MSCPSDRKILLTAQTRWSLSKCDGKEKPKHGEAYAARVDGVSGKSLTEALSALPPTATVYLEPGDAEAFHVCTEHEKLLAPSDAREWRLHNLGYHSLVKLPLGALEEKT
jgi:hypothetical protein